MGLQDLIKIDVYKMTENNGQHRKGKKKFALVGDHDGRLCMYTAAALGMAGTAHTVSYPKQQCQTQRGLLWHSNQFTLRTVSYNKQQS